MSKTPQQIIHEHHKEIGKKGGVSKSTDKVAAARKNMEKALEARWGKKFKLVPHDD